MLPATYGSQWNKYLSGISFAYRNVPHDSTGEKPPIPYLAYTQIAELTLKLLFTLNSALNALSLILLPQVV